MNAFEILSRMEFAKILEQAIKKLNPAAVIMGFLQAFFHFDANVTEIRRKCYKNLACEETEHQTLLISQRLKLSCGQLKIFWVLRFNLTTYKTSQVPRAY